MSVPRMKATSSSEKPSSDSSRKACRGNGVMLESRRSGGIASVATSALSLSETEFQICVNSRNSPARGPCRSSSSEDPAAGPPAWPRHRRRRTPGFRSAHGHSAATAANVQQRAVIGTSPLHSCLEATWPESVQLRVDASGNAGRPGSPSMPGLRPSTAKVPSNSSPTPELSGELRISL